ncbi:hypothetical protein [uncultured Dokdonia sp.]|uniref:hypothetical protein n=1 Tax=uncultured Dokdonia sp. TaxID=575653 RepID=UPI002612C75C|nr:hypothetical protein [uncultured Dokdonia sp.]
MKTTLTLLLLCFCTPFFAQSTTGAKEEENITSYAPFAWYKKQLEEKEDTTSLSLGKNLEELQESLKLLSEPKQEVIVSKNKMPIYPLSDIKTEPMPVFPVDSTVTHHLKVYPVKD